MKTQSELVKEIHDSFESFSKQKVLRTKSDYEKLGLMELAKTAPPDNISELIQHYRFYYPQTFITEEGVKAICEKYGLVLGDVSDFKGHIPEKNFQELCSFRVKDEDVENPFKDEIAYHLKMKRLFKVLSICAAVVFILVLLTAIITGKESMFWVSYAAGALMSTLIGVFRRNDYDDYDKSLILLLPITLIIGYIFLFTPSNDDPQKIPVRFKVVAPQSFFNMERKKVVGHEIVEDDPVFLCPVKGGYLVVTAYGPEASDDNVRSERLN